jgi:single-strand DNA-binding protein
MAGRIGEVIMADYNKVLLLGRLAQDPELRHIPSGSAVTDLRLATSRKYTTKEGDRREETLYIDITVWNRQAENCCEYLRKGSAVFVEGSLRMDTWTDKASGENRSKIKVDAERVQFLDSRRGEDAGSADDEGQGQSPGPGASRGRHAGSGNGHSRPGPSQSAPAAPASARRPAPGESGSAEDIPF